MIHTDGSDGSRTEKEDIEEDPSMRTDAYLSLHAGAKGHGTRDGVLQQSIA